MSSSDFSKVLIRDERLDCADTIPFAVYRSGSNVTVATFESISASASSLVFNVQVPSETTVIDRRVIWETTLEFNVVGIAPSYAASNNLKCVEYGVKQAFGPWPAHSLCNTMQATINNNSVTQNTADVLPALSRLHDMRELARYNGMDPIKVDNLQQYADGNNAIYNVLGSALNIAMENDYKPRGAQLCSISFLAADNISCAAAGPSSTLGAPIAAGQFSYKVRATFREPLLMAPFIYTHPFYNGQGFYGIQNMNFVFNLNPQAVGLWRVMDNFAYDGPSPSTQGLYFNNVAPTISGLSITNSRLIFNFLTPKPSDLLAARNVVPYWEMPRYLKSSCLGALATSVYDGNQLGSVPVPFPTESIQSQSLQLNQVPDKLIIFFRPTTPTAFDSNRSLIIQNIRINWNNQSGILASATQDQLWRYSVESGSTQTWEEFSGVTNLARGGGTPQTVVVGTSGNYFKQQIPTVGSYLMLDFAKHINITEDYYAPGSLGNFNLQFEIGVASNRRQVLGQMDMVIITVNSGLFVTEKGQSATYTGILTKDDVLSAAAMKPESDAEARRMVGGFSLTKGFDFARKAIGNVAKYGDLGKAAASFLPDTGVLGKLKSGVNTGVDLAQKFAPSGQGRMKGMGKGSSSFRIEDRLV
jgi:hypothetical protein